VTPPLSSNDRFPSIWMPPVELWNLRALLRHRDQWVRVRARVKSAARARTRPWSSPHGRTVDARGSDHADTARCCLRMLLSTLTATVGVSASTRAVARKLGYQSLDSLMRSDRLRRVLPSHAIARDGAVTPVCGDACVEIWTGEPMTGKMKIDPPALRGVRMSHHGPP